MAIEVNIEVRKSAKFNYPRLVVNVTGIVWIAFGKRDGMCLNPLVGDEPYLVKNSPCLNFEEVGRWSLYRGEITLKNKPE